MSAEVHTTSIPGVELHQLQRHEDHRGSVGEFFREVWRPRFGPVQWHAIRSEPGALRGVHVHVLHEDWKVVLDGRVSHFFKDLRQGSPTEGATDVIEASADTYEALVIPRGVAHGFYSHDRSLVVVGVNRYYDGEDDFACHWSDPDLGIAWPARPEIVSERDRSAPPLRELLELLEPWQPIGGAIA